VEPAFIYSRLKDETEGGGRSSSPCIDSGSRTKVKRRRWADARASCAGPCHTRRLAYRNGVRGLGATGYDYAMPAAGANQDKRNRWVLAIVLAVAAIVRLPGLETVPPPLNQDEASRGYDAWAILETGADRHGQRWPFFLESFGPGDYTAALSTYITVPFVAALGPTTLAMRLPDALLGVLTVGLLYLWLKRQVGVTIALIAAAVLAVDPWHIALCRTAHESGFTPFFLVMAMLAMHWSGLLPGSREETLPGKSAASEARPAWALLAGIMLGLHAWAYPATRFFTPLFFVAIVLIYCRQFVAFVRGRTTRLTFLCLALGLFAGLLPLIITTAAHPERLAARAQATLLIYRDLSAGEVVWSFIRNYGFNLNPGYLFLQCDEMSGIVIPHVGQHLLMLAPLMVIGLVRAIAGWRRSAWCRLMMAWFLLYPVPAAICADWNPHPMRTVAGLLLFPILAAMGGDWLLQRAAGWRKGLRRVAGTVVGAAVIINLAHFANAYFREFRVLARPGYQTALAEAMQYVAQHAQEVDFVMVTNYTNQPYIYALLYAPIQPPELARTPMVATQGTRGFHQVLRVGKYYFAPKNLPEAVRLFEREWQRLPRSAEGFVIDFERQNPKPPGRVVQRVLAGKTSSGSPAYLDVCRWRIGEGAGAAPGP
jgi:4-amino-4-deoxy-L-arabinose transferase-like glycosyltransferase